jgi:hypothetical protein
VFAFKKIVSQPFCDTVMSARTYLVDFAVEDGQDIIPYTSFFQNEKVSLTFPTRLTFHDVAFGTTPLKVVNTSWLNYYFVDEECEHTLHP